MTKRKRSDELDAALRADPDYQELRALLSKQTAKQKARLEAALSQQCDGSQEGEGTMKTDVDDRIRTLKDVDGRPYTQIAEILTLEGFQDSTGNPLSVKAIRSRYYRMKKKAASQLSQTGETSGEKSVSCEPGEPCESKPSGSPDSQESQRGEPSEELPSDSGESQLSQPCEAETKTEHHCESSEPSQVIPAEWLEPLRELIKEEIEAVMTATSAHVAKHEIDLPPRRPKKEGSREHAGDKVTLPGTRIDQVLFDKFDEEREGVGISASELMERILWHRYGRPKLSFEDD